MPSPQFDVTVHFGDSLSAKYDRRIRLFCPSYDALHQMIVPWVQGLPENSTFLSAGAGTGAEVVTLGEWFPSWRFVAVDASIDMLDACRRRTDEAGITDRVAFFHGRLEGLSVAGPVRRGLVDLRGPFHQGATRKVDIFSLDSREFEARRLAGDRRPFRR